MDRESVDRLRFDRRLQSRRDWLDASEHDAYLESLPDVADKMTTAAELEAEEEATRSDAGAASPAPTPAAAGEPTGFGNPTSVGGGGFGGDGTSFGG